MLSLNEKKEQKKCKSKQLKFHQYNNHITILTNLLPIKSPLRPDKKDTIKKRQYTDVIEDIGGEIGLIGDVNQGLSSYELNDLKYYTKFQQPKYSSESDSSDSVILTKAHAHPQSTGLGTYTTYNTGNTKYYTATERPALSNTYAKPLEEPAPFDAYAPKPKNTNIFKNDLGISNLKMGQAYYPQTVTYMPETENYAAPTTVRYQTAPPKYKLPTINYASHTAHFAKPASVKFQQQSQSTTFSPQSTAFSPKLLQPIITGVDSGFGSLKIYSLDDERFGNFNQFNQFSNPTSSTPFASIPEHTTVTTVRNSYGDPSYHHSHYSSFPNVSYDSPTSHSSLTQEYETAILRFNPGTSELTISIPSQYVDSISNAYHSSTSVKVKPTESTPTYDHGFSGGPQVTYNGDLGLQTITSATSAESPYTPYLYSTETTVKHVPYEPVYPPLSATSPYQQTTYDTSSESHTHYFSDESTNSLLPSVPHHEIQSTIDNPIGQQTVVPTSPPKTYHAPHKVTPTPSSTYPFKLGNLIAHKKPGTNQVLLEMPNWHPLFHEVINGPLGLKEANLPKVTTPQAISHDVRPVIEYQTDVKNTQLFQPSSPPQFNGTHYTYKSNEVVYQPQQSDHVHYSQHGKLLPGKNHNIQEIINAPTAPQGLNATNIAKAGSKKTYRHTSFFEVIRNAANKLTSGLFGGGGAGAGNTKGGLGKKGGVGKSKNNTR